MKVSIMFTELGVRVHAEGCRDIRKEVRQGKSNHGQAWPAEYDSVQAICEGELGDFFVGPSSDHPEHTWEDYAEEIDLAPCVGKLPGPRPSEGSGG